jgi:hypothetical protein
MGDDESKPISKLYFIKKSTETMLRQGRKPVIGKIEEVNPRNIETKQEFLLDRVVKRDEVPKGKKKRQASKETKGDAQQRLTEFGKKERARRAEKREELPAVGDVAELRRKLSEKGIVAKQEKARQEIIENARKETERVAEERKTQALLALPPALERARVAIERLEPLQQAQLIALNNVAPEVSRNIVDEWARRFPASVATFATPTSSPTATPTPTPLPTLPLPSAFAPIRLPPSPSPAPSYTSVATPVPPAPVGVDVRVPDTPSNLKQLQALFKEPGRDYATLIMALDRIPSKRLEKRLQDAVDKGEITVSFERELDAIVKDKQAVGKGLSFKKKGREAKKAKKTTGGALPTIDEEGGGFFDTLKDVAKKGVEKLVEKVSDDPIGAVKKAFEMGQQAKGAYASHFGKKLGKGGKLFITKKIHKKLHAHMKKIKGGGWADAFLSGLTLPFQLASKIPIPGVQQVGQAGTGIASALGLPSLL